MFVAVKRNYFRIWNINYSVIETGTDRNGGNAVTRSWEYDTSGRVKKAVAGGFCYTYEYRTDGKLKEIRHGNGMYTLYEYGTDGNVIHLRLKRPDGRALSDW